MQTFLPYPDFEKSASVLDYKRLGKQRVEAQQILNTLVPGSKSGWRNHPAVRMWKGYKEALKLYRNTMIIEWKKRGYNNTMRILPVRKSRVVYPHWFGDERFHSSHRSNLLRKDPEYYSQFGWSESPLLEYIWPV